MVEDYGGLRPIVDGSSTGTYTPRRVHEVHAPLGKYDAGNGKQFEVRVNSKGDLEYAFAGSNHYRTMHTTGDHGIKNGTINVHNVQPEFLAECFKRIRTRAGFKPSAPLDEIAVREMDRLTATARGIDHTSN